MNAAAAIQAYLEAVRDIEENKYDGTEPSHHQRSRVRWRRARACFQDLLDFAEPGSPEIWHAVGTGFQSGHGLVNDPLQAARWLERAAQAGHVRAMVDLARVLSSPPPGSDPQGAIAWLHRAAALGNAKAMVFLGFAYREGRGVPEDAQAAAEWFRRAAAAGDTHAWVLAGRVLAYWLGLPAEALDCFLKAAEAEQLESYVEIAQIYDDRNSALHNPVEAYRWYRMAADHSEGTCIRAVLALGRLYAEGRGVACDAAQARFWLQKVIDYSRCSNDFTKEAAKLLGRLDGALL